jgi:hypothetical protein
MTQSQCESIRHLNTNIDELLSHIEFADTGFHCVPDSDVEKGNGERYERSFQVELDETNTRIGVTGLLSEQQSQYVATIHLNDEGQCTNPSTELPGTMSDGLLSELSDSIHGKLEAKQRRQSTNAPSR